MSSKLTTVVITLELDTAQELFRWRTEMPNGEPMSDELRRHIANCLVAILEISREQDSNPNEPIKYKVH